MEEPESLYHSSTKLNRSIFQREFCPWGNLKNKFMHPPFTGILNAHLVHW